MDIERLWKLAEDAAGLLPEAPVSGGALHWMAWRELVWETARRLGEIGGSALPDLATGAVIDPNVTSVDPCQLMKLAAMLQRDAVVGLVTEDAAAMRLR
ncbi:hypothetical protein [Mycobacterium sp. 48b]|uniref:hypothetical protein n=1 Tax=Mycobacterium sp. 48b TaxID=3400426 RepID=UPI003AACD9DA